ncbi:hypothetical protein PFISCL1PPCAC_16979, partial [Pristionchus fissidentatus]
LLVLDTTTLETLSIKLPHPGNYSACRYFMVGAHGGEITVKQITTPKEGPQTIALCKSKFPEAFIPFEEAVPEIREKREKEEEERRKIEEEERRRREEEEKRRREEEREKRKPLVADIQGAMRE